MSDPDRIPPPADQLHLRAPHAADGPAVTALIAACPPLDQNSAYCNLLQCEHFAAHCVLAEQGGQVIGWVSGYRPPSDPTALFVWQVAVAPQGRGKHLASRMINHLLARPAQRGVTHLITTITDDNAASWGLFQRLADTWGATLARSTMFDQQTHFAGAHATEFQARIGPLDHVNFNEQRG